MNEQSRRDRAIVAIMFRRIDFFRQMISVGVYGAFLAMRIARGDGYLWINAGLSVVNAAYAIATAIRYFAGAGKAWKRRINQIYRWMKIVFSLFAVSITVYSVVTAVNAPTAFEITFAILSVVTIFLKILTAIVSVLVRRKVERVKAKRREKRQAKQPSAERPLFVRLLRRFYFFEPARPRPPIAEPTETDEPPFAEPTETDEPPLAEPT
ncbi:MAG: hypothetical protein ACI4NG_00945, partial [Candidatus Gallimonas sp.]